MTLTELAERSEKEMNKFNKNINFPLCPLRALRDINF
jgi:hypothetical protein